MINIVANSSSPHDVKFKHQDGSLISGVCECDIKLRVDELNRAVLTIYTENIDISAEPLLALQTVRDAAEYYGYTLTPMLTEG